MADDDRSGLLRRQCAGRKSVRVSVLDVGQGLAVVIQADGRTLVYDTGHGFLDDFSQAEKVLIPFLQTRVFTRSMSCSSVMPIGTMRVA